MDRNFFIMFLGLIILIVLSPIVMIGLVVSSIDTNSTGLFLQKRIGKNGKAFIFYKLQTIKSNSLTISPIGKWFRKSKIDELPQLFNIIKGDMCFVGPRPDVPGYADMLVGEDRILLNLFPGITGLASLKYRNEEALLATKPNPKVYNDTFIWPDKVRINKWYLHNRTFLIDMKILCFTLLPIPFNAEEFMQKNTKRKK